MAIYFFTKSPGELLRRFDASVSQAIERGRPGIWVRGNDAHSYTHIDECWRGKSWLKARVDDDRLTFNIIREEDRYVSVAGYAFFYSQIVETFINNLGLNFDDIGVTPRCTDGDIWS